VAAAHPLSLRPIGPGDREFLFAVYASTRTGELAAAPWTDAQKEAFLRQQFEAQDRFWREHYDGTGFQVVEVDGVPAGRLYVHRSEAEIRIVDVALLPAFRGAGLGTRLLASIFEEADARGLPVRIHVETFNPARRLYERLGFAAEADAGVYVRMERAPRFGGPGVS
jgi:GNAT superfamily N-acetyltransferase